MNSSSIMKRTLPLILVLVLIIGIAVSCTLLSNKKTAPSISNPDDAYLSSDILTIKNKDIYDYLKYNYGYQVTLDLIDRQILANVNGKNYLAAVTEEDIAEFYKEHKTLKKFAEIEKTPEDKKDKFIQMIYDEIYFETGLKTKEEIDEFVRLELARKLYVKDIIIEESKTEEDYFKDSDYSTQLKNNYKSDVAAIIISYGSQYELETALKQLGVKQSKDKSKWVKTGDDDTEVELTLDEIKRVFIDLYNSANTHRVPTYPNSQLVLQEGVHYSIVDGAITFNHDNFNHQSELVYTQEDLDKLKIGTLVYDDLIQISEEPKEKAFTVKYEKQYDGKYYLVLKIENGPKKELTTIVKDNVTIKDEITKKFIEQKLTSTNKDNITKFDEEITKLRRERNLIIYDPLISLYYKYSDKEFKETKKSNSRVVAVGDGFEITADELFKELTVLYGPGFVTDKLLLNYLLNSEFNNFYDIKTNKFLTKEAKTKYNDAFAIRKLQIKQEYSQLSPYFTMEEFLLMSYGVRTLEETKYQLFYNDIIEDYRKDFADVEKNWDIYDNLMKANLEKFFEVQGMHLLIQIADEETGKPIDPKEWTEYQVNLAKELTTLIKQTLKKEVTGSKTYSSIMTKIVDDFNNAPRLVAGYDVDSKEAKPLYDENVIYQEVDYKYSKFKSAGLTLLYQDLGTIKPGAMVQPFEDAVRYMWKTNEAAGQHNDNKARLYDNPENEYIETEFGFHLLVATNTIAYKYANLKDKTLPTKQDVLNYFDTAKRKELSEDVRKAIEANVMPLYVERKGEVNNETGQMRPNLTDIHLLDQLKDLAQKTSLPQQTKDNLVYFIEAKKRVTNESLVFEW